ncbi:hypothetical protein KY290_014866 [Solanum tuberosum]|uniref:MLO-like protein n=1 Tax=Solanum tuberosum TaxID=4113 RepID=A0ABQ7VRH6_SOLTU|nr:hypothetical protein KY290_014866 [Solanum tuberosum]
MDIRVELVFVYELAISESLICHKRHKKALFEALEKVKAELMILGFISLTLVFSQYYIAGICIPTSVADTMLPCLAKNKGAAKEEEHRRKLLWYERRILAGEGPKCKEGVPLVTVEALHQIHILIFFLAVLHVLYSAITMWLGRLKIRGWKGWEQETSTHNYEFTNDPSRFRLTHETSFVRAHTSFWTRIPIFFYIGCFFRQFFKSVSKSDYLALRNGFISVHLAPGSKFNFQKYIKRSLEDDSSPVLWASFVLFLLLNVSGWQALFWASLVPLIIILAVGTKLQAVLTRMALDIKERHAVVQGIPLVQASDKYFWFGRPRLVLHIIHFALFQNAFQITYFLWIWYEYELKSCFHEAFELVIAKIVIGVGVLFLCSYITLPLYAIITQMGSHMKKSIFDEQTSKALKKWHMAVKKRTGARGDRSPTRTLGNASPRSALSSPVHPSGPGLHRYKITGHSSRFQGYSDQEASDLENDPTTPMTRAENATTHIDHDDTEIHVHIPQNGESTRNEDDFSFVKPAPQRMITCSSKNNPGVSP